MAPRGLGLGFLEHLDEEQCIFIEVTKEEGFELPGANCGKVNKHGETTDDGLLRELPLACVQAPRRLELSWDYFCPSL